MNLKTLRDKAGLSKEEVCASLGITVSTLWRWETGRTCPPANKIKDLAKALKCKVTDLLKEPA